MAMERMDLKERYKYLRILKPHYRRAGRKAKGDMLKEAHRATGLNRKYLITLLNAPGPNPKPAHGRKGSRTYDEQVDAAIAVIADTLDWICSDRLQPGAPRGHELQHPIGVIDLSQRLARQQVLPRLGLPPHLDLRHL